MHEEPLILRCKNCNMESYEQLGTHGYCYNCNYSADVDGKGHFSTLKDSIKELIEYYKKELRSLEETND